VAKKQWAFRWLTVAIAHLTIGCTNFRNTKREVYCYSLKFDNFDMSYLYKTDVLSYACFRPKGKLTCNFVNCMQSRVSSA